MSIDDVCEYCLASPGHLCKIHAAKLLQELADQKALVESYRQALLAAQGHSSDDSPESQSVFARHPELAKKVLAEWEDCHPDSEPTSDSCHTCKYLGREQDHPDGLHSAETSKSYCTRNQPDFDGRCTNCGDKHG